MRVCLACGHRVIPYGVRAPYERGTAAVRQVRSQRERDLDALALARRKGVMLAQLAQLADDDRLHPESRPVVEWLADQVKTAAAETRLNELAALLPEAGIRRRHRWQGRPAALAAVPAWEDDDQDQDDEDGDDYDSGGSAGPVPLALAPTPDRGSGRPMTWADALDRLGWRLIRLRDGCEVSEGGPACGADIRASIGDGWACQQHYAALAELITRSQR
jgi:hypothetical protein